MAYYLDTSALAKLVAVEPESAAFRAWFDRTEVTPVSSDLARTELMRAARRVDPSLSGQVRAVLDGVTLIALSPQTWASAGLLDPAILRTLDALHLSVALELGDDLEGMVSYDDRLSDAAANHGIPVLSPR